MFENLTWTVTVGEDPESKELVIPFPEDMLKLLDWKEGDAIDFTENEDGSWTVSKVQKTDDPAMPSTD